VHQHIDYGMEKSHAVEASTSEQDKHLRTSLLPNDEDNKTKSQFLANMSHELRTPLNAITGLSYLLAQTELNSIQRDYLAKINRSAENLLYLINDILVSSKIEEGNQTLELRDFLVQDLLTGVADITATKAAEKKVELIYDLDPTCPVGLRGDDSRLVKILVNLVDNAIKFNDFGGEVVLSLEQLTSGPCVTTIKFSVRDNGIGIDSAQQHRLFQPFSQIDESTNRSHRGTGLGLAISRHLVEAMGGEIGVASVLGQGSEFHFTLTFGVPGIGERRLPSDRDQLGEVIIILLDTSAASFCALQKTLNSLGVKVHRISNLSSLKVGDGHGQRELLVVNSNALTNASLTELTNASHRLPILLLTVHKQELELKKAIRDAGHIHWLDRPFTANQLAFAIQQALSLDADSATAIASFDTNEAKDVLPGSRVLVVDDDLLSQRIFVELLTRKGVVVKSANNGQEAVDLIKAQVFDAVLMDCQMPVMNGYQAARAIRGFPGQEDLPIIALTASAMSGDRERVLAADMNDYVTKPIQIEAFIKTLCYWLKGIRKHEIDRQHEKTTPAANFHSVSSQKVPGLVGVQVNEMQKLLAQSDIRSGDILLAVESALEGTRFAPLVAQLGERVRYYDYEGALQLAKMLALEIGDDYD
jgi:CheY-like chemotaxis protein/nitrogen-specific signal transduction histidine kinase